MQFHEINYDNDPDWIVEKGAWRADQAKKRARSAFWASRPQDPRIHLAMLSGTAGTRCRAINVCDWHYRSFVKQVVPEANKKGVGVIGMKSLAGSKRLRALHRQQGLHARRRAPTG